MESIPEKVISDVAYSLLAKTATQYPKNYFEKLLESLGKEENGKSKSVIATMIQNILYAAEGSASLCQDMGVPTFQVYLNPGFSIEGDVRRALTEATIRATEIGDKRHLPLLTRGHSTLHKYAISPPSVRTAGMSSRRSGTPFLECRSNWRGGK